MHWPCEFSNTRGRCVNVSARHGKKGHQNDKGKVFAVGDYKSAFKSIDYKVKWMNIIEVLLADFQEELQDLENKNLQQLDHVELIRKLHMKNISQFYRHLNGARSYGSHGTCLCCLIRIPEYALRCGHVLCSKCVVAYGKARRATFEMDFCPLHPDKTR